MVLHVEDFYGLNSLGAGLVFFALVIPTIFASPLAGWISDKWGAKWVACLGVCLSIAAYPLLIIKGPLPLFCFFLVILGVSLSFFLTPTTQDLSIVVAETPGLPSTYAYGAFNLFYSVGSFIGPYLASYTVSPSQELTGALFRSSLRSRRPNHVRTDHRSSQDQQRMDGNVSLVYWAFCCPLAFRCSLCRRSASAATDEGDGG